MLFQGVSLQVRVYVDGFNLYYGAVKGTSYKWLNPVELARQLVPADYDLVEPIRMVTTERGKPVMVVCPGRWAMAAKLRTVASHVRHIHSAMLRAAQFPPLIPGTTISKPQGW